MARIIRFPTERVRRGTTTPTLMPIVCLPFALNSYLWLCCASSVLDCMAPTSENPGRKR
jgi:hypothetical protein